MMRTCANCDAPLSWESQSRWCADCVRMALKTWAVWMLTALLGWSLRYGLTARHAVTAWLCR